MLKYTSVGSRETPTEELMLQSKFVYLLNRAGALVRTGDCKLGGDLYTRHSVKFHPEAIEVYSPKDVSQAALDLAAKFHPYWHNCKDYHRLLHARNGYQVLGPLLNDPSSFMLCYTASGAITHEERLANFKATGGTGQAIALAEAHRVPVFNLGRSDHKAMIEDFVYKGIPFHETLSEWLKSRPEYFHFATPKSKDLITVVNP